MDGEVTSHLSGMMYRTIRMRENGIKPVYVFDGKPPAMKRGEVFFLYTIPSRLNSDLKSSFKFFFPRYFSFFFYDLKK